MFAGLCLAPGVAGRQSSGHEAPRMFPAPRTAQEKTASLTPGREEKGERRGCVYVRYGVLPQIHTNTHTHTHTQHYTTHHAEHTHTYYYTGRGHFLCFILTLKMFLSAPARVRILTRRSAPAGTDMSSFSPSTPNLASSQRNMYLNRWTRRGGGRDRQLLD